MRIFLSTLLLLITLATSAQQKWSIRQCIEYASNNNITVKQALAQAKLSQVSYQQARMSRLPTLNGNISANYQHGLNENPTTGTLESSDFIAGNIGLQTQYNIFNWGARKHNIAANELFAKADAVGVGRAKNDISLLVANAFLQVMLRREQIRVNEVQLEQTRAQLSNTRKLVNAGSQPELNAIQIEAQLVRDSALLLQTRALEKQALITLQSYLNIDLATPFDIEAPPVETIPVESLAALQPEDVYAVAVTTQPVQLMTGMRIQASEMQAKSARASMYPTITAFGSLNTRFVDAGVPTLIGIQPNQPTGAVVVDGSGNTYNVLAPKAVFETRPIALHRQLNTNFGQAIGLSLNFPIFNQWSTRSQWERAKVNVQQAQLQDEQEKLTLKSNIYSAYQDAFASLQIYNASLRNVEASERAFNISQKRLDVGLLGTLDYLITQGNLNRARIEAVSNRYDYIFKLKVLEFYKGMGVQL
ncbi:TolC family protein [Aridibaculum aurantiacum]|uniref:TolC family protein n=1 Tax=Aridibaculum aurantiacum TaxID=2810307 RepID=UPI001A975D8D|nr:TolC family protein [Aridibaculum aurantiacum]